MLNGKRHNLGKDEAEARKRYHALLLTSHEEAQPGGSLRSIVKGYLAQLKRTAHSNSHRRSRAWLLAMPQALLNKPASALTIADGEAWLADHAGWSESTIRSAMATLLASLNWAVRQRLLTGNPLKGWAMPAMRSRGEEAIISADDYAKIIASIADAEFRCFVMALRLSGARPSELARATAKDVNAESGTLILERHKTAAKTGKKRIILLVPEMVAMLQALAEKHPSGELFRSKSGLAWKANTIVQRFRSISKKAKVKCIAYGFRHSFASERLQGGMPDHDVAALLGHSGTAMLHKHYAHLLGNTQRLRQSLCASITTTEEERNMMGQDEPSQA